MNTKRRQYGYVEIPDPMTTDRNSEGAGTTSAPVAFNYAALHRFAMENRVDYNALARLVRESVYTPPASIPAAEVQALVEADKEYDAASEAWDNAPGCVQAAGDTDGRDCDGPEFQRYVAAMDRRNRALDELAKLIPRGTP